MRPTSEVIAVEGWLVAESELHVGGLTADPGADLTVAVDGLGRHHLPGTGIAGALRAWIKAASTRDPAEIDALWGSTESASLVTVDDGMVFPSLEEGIAALGPGGTLDPLHRPSTAACVEFRAGVGLDRATGAASPGILYTKQVLRRGVAIRIQFSASGRDRNEALQLRALMLCLIDGLTERQIRFGAGRSRGLGLVRLDRGSARVQHVDMSSPDGVLSRLVGLPRLALDLFDWNLPEPAKIFWARPTEITIPWTARSPLMVKDAIEGLEIDSLPLMVEDAGREATGADPEGTAEGVRPVTRRPVLPGSSIKGSLRQHAERIVRTSRGLDLPVPMGTAKERNRFLDHLDELSLVTALFGRGGPPAEVSSADPRAHHGMSALWVNDVSGEAPISRADWELLVFGAPTTAGSGDRRPDGSRAANLGKLLPRTHVALDRWTGGAADGLLFSILEPWDVSWEHLYLELHLGRYTQEERLAMLTLVLFLLRDLCAGMIPMGFGVNRGMGSVEAVADKITLLNLPPVPVEGDAECDAPAAASLANLLSGELAWTAALVKAWGGNWNPAAAAIGGDA